MLYSVYTVLPFVPPVFFLFHKVSPAEIPPSKITVKSILDWNNFSCNYLEIFLKTHFIFVSISTDDLERVERGYIVTRVNNQSAYAAWPRSNIMQISCCEVILRDLQGRLPLKRRQYLRKQQCLNILRKRYTNML